DRRHPYARRADAGPARLPVRTELPRRRRDPHRLRRRRRGASGGVLARRADVVLPLAQGDPAGARRGLSLHRARPARIRALGQADRPRLVHVRPARRGRARGRRAPRPAGRHVRRPRLGRAGRPAGRDRARRPRRPPRDHGHRPLHRPPEDERRVAGVRGVRPQDRGPADLVPRRRRVQDDPVGRGQGRLRCAVPQPRLEGRRPRLPADDPARAPRAGRRGRAARRGGARRRRPPDARAVGRPGPDPHPRHGPALREEDRGPRARGHPGGEPLPPGGPGPEDRRADRPVAYGV
ncbi:MAG: Hydrolase, alpha/beta fold family protein, At1g52510/AT4G12830 homolog, group4, partial [uncultured Solirubrobacteraceae bacterium]